MANRKAHSTRLGVLDIGSNTVHMLIVDAAVGSRPEPEASTKTTVRLMDFLKEDGYRLIRICFLRNIHHPYKRFLIWLKIFRMFFIC